MRVLHVIPDGKLGGGNVNVARLASVLPDFIQSDFLIPFDSADAVKGLFPRESTHQGAYTSRGSPLAIARSIRGRRALQFDLIHAHGTRAAAGTMLARVLGTKTPIVYTVRGYHGLYNPGFARSRIYLEKLLGRCFDMTVFVSDADRAIGQACGLKYRMTRLIPNGVNLRGLIGESKDIDVVYVGRLVYQKDPEAFIKAIALLKPPRIVHLVGDGELKARVEALTASSGLKITIHGQLSHPEAVALMARARVLVMTSRWEGLPTTAIEAPLTGTAVVGFDIPSLREVLGETANEVLVPERNTVKLSYRIGDILENGRAEEIAEIQRERMVKEYSMESMAARYVNAYQDLCGRNIE